MSHLSLYLKHYMSYGLDAKSSLRHLQIWEFLANVLKINTDKMKSCLEASFFVGYPKGTCTDHSSNKVYLSTDIIPQKKCQK